MNKLILIASLFTISHSAIGAEPLKPTKTPPEKYNYTTVSIGEHCQYIGKILEHPDNVLSIYMYEGRATKGKECNLTLVHKGKSISGEIIFEKTKQNALGVLLYGINTVTI